jgi:alpha-N-arabinofuranosidase
VEYCNAATSTIGGGWRAKNGHTQPYGVEYWCVGNEMFGPWQLGFMQMQHYVQKHNLVADAMWKVDPNLKLTAVGDLTTINKDHDPDQAKSGKTCSHIMLEECADHMTMLSEHFYRGRLPWTQEGRTDVATHAGMMKDSIRQKAEGHRKLQASLPNLHGRIVPIAMDEWNYWHREYVYGELGCAYELQDGLGIAEGLHEYYRNSDLIHAAFYAQTVNVIGAIKTSKIAAEMETTGLVLQLYRAHYGTTPLLIAGEQGPYDVAAALTADGRAITVSVVNPTNAAVELKLDFGTARPAGSATRWHITGANPEVHNAPGQPRVVDIAKTENVNATAPLAVPALSCALFEIPVGQP